MVEHTIPRRPRITRTDGRQSFGTKRVGGQGNKLPGEFNGDGDPMGIDPGIKRTADRDAAFHHAFPNSPESSVQPPVFLAGRNTSRPLNSTPPAQVGTAAGMQDGAVRGAQAALNPNGRNGATAIPSGISSQIVANAPENPGTLTKPVRFIGNGSKGNGIVIDSGITNNQGQFSGSKYTPSFRTTDVAGRNGSQPGQLLDSMGAAEQSRFVDRYQTRDKETGQPTGRNGLLAPAPQIKPAGMSPQFAHDDVGRYGNPDAAQHASIQGMSPAYARDDVGGYTMPKTAIPVPASGPAFTGDTPAARFGQSARSTIGGAASAVGNAAKMASAVAYNGSIAPVLDAASGLLGGSGGNTAPLPVGPPPKFNPTNAQPNAVARQARNDSFLAVSPGLTPQQQREFTASRLNDLSTPGGGTNVSQWMSDNPLDSNKPAYFDPMKSGIKPAANAPSDAENVRLANRSATDSSVLGAIGNYPGRVAANPVQPLTPKPIPNAPTTPKPPILTNGETEEERRKRQQVRFTGGRGPVEG